MSNLPVNTTLLNFQNFDDRCSLIRATQPCTTNPLISRRLLVA
ncbi:hypothetical protein NIES2104_63940 [Leptolyngbya sp. NIES-2104]|nr:hypothetical protein NIES2104_63940 [Leptolyngbya sp. NIES-2104]